jgi:hypothetical protein
VVTALEAEGSLAEGWTVERATDRAWGQSHLTAWQHMVMERGWPAEEFAERCVRSILDEVVRTGRASR